MDVRGFLHVFLNNLQFSWKLLMYRYNGGRIKMSEYMRLQRVFIHKYAKHFKLIEEDATWKWVERGLAVRFSQVYRCKLIKDN